MFFTEYIILESLKYKQHYPYQLLPALYSDILYSNDHIFILI